MTAPLLQFRAAGIPATQGSKRVVVNGGRPRAIDANQAKLIPWRNAVQVAAEQAAGPGWVTLLGPVRCILLFALPKPASAPKRRRTWPDRKPDLDKLVRACFDSITNAGIWRDDSQVVRHEAVKDWPEHLDQMSPGVIIRIWRVDGPTSLSTGQIPLLAQEVS